jgi:hypothetical protein
VVKSKTSINTWRDLIKDTVHPAGFELFGEVLVESDGNTSMPSDIENNKTESITFMNAGLGKTLNSQFQLTKHTKTLGELFAKIGVELNKVENNLTKGMASYLTMLGLTVAPMLMLIGHWRKISFLIGESNMKGSIFARRLFYASSAMSALYLTTTDWNKILEDIKENPLKGIITHLDTAIALGLTLSGAFMGMGKMIDLLNIKLLATNKTLGFIAKNPVIRLAGLAMMAYDVVTDDGLIQKNIEKARSGGNSPLTNLGSTPANNNSIEMLANLQSQPKVEVVNNINVDKSGNVSVDTKTKDKNTYVSPYSAPIMSDFSLGY